MISKSKPIKKSPKKTVMKNSKKVTPAIARKCGTQKMK